MAATLNPDQATIDRARALRATGMTFKQIGEVLDVAGNTVSIWCGRGTGNADKPRGVPPGYQTWVETFLEAPIGQPVVYHEMDLEKASDERDRSAFLAAWNLCQQGKLSLTQKRVDGKAIHYRATRIR